MDNLGQLMSKRAFILLVGFSIVVLFLLVIFSSSFTKPKQNVPPQNQPGAIEEPQSTNNTNVNLNVEPTQTFTPEQIKVIQEQSKADEIVGAREVEIKTNYPWFINLPLRGEKYFVYFEQNRKVFVGLLYPKAGDNVEDMKAEVTRKLKQDFQVTDLEQYPFEWKITPE